ncbi:unnamed protein product [Rotaria socialis]|uniref:Uncharacterized protein n=1 Tax=Rotaria socialis TaxID=392032 RepID=A0A821IN40_9BILA|nr:unnamed protein product [Rotaria socialis]
MRQENAQKQKHFEKIHDINQRKSSSLAIMATSTSPSTDKVKFSTLLPLYQSSMKGKLSLRSRSQRTRQCNLEDNKTVEVPVENALAVPKENLPRNPSQQSLSSVPTTPQPGIEPTKEGPLKYILFSSMNIFFSGFSGYLFKRSHNKFKTWSRFVMEYYFKTHISDIY